MKKYTLIGIVIAVIALLIIIPSCKKDSTNSEDFIIQIDSIVHVDTINFGDNLNIKFYGVIGDNSCYAFNKFEPVYTSNTLSITTWGLYTNNDMCYEEIPYLNGESLIVSEIPAGNMTITIIQADGDDFTQSVFVKE